MSEVNIKENGIIKFFAPFLPWRDEFNPLKIMLWFYLGACVFVTIMVLRAALVCYFTGARSCPLWFW